MNLLRELGLASLPNCHLGLRSASRVAGLRDSKVNHLLRDEVERGTLPMFHPLPGIPRIHFRDLAVWYEEESEKFLDRHRSKSVSLDYRTRPLLNACQAFAHLCVNHALKSGLLERGNCIYCGALAEAHHPDYHKPLWVVWLCKSHHMAHHARITPRRNRVHQAQPRRYAQPATAIRDYGISRSTLFNWLHDELVRSTVIRKAGSRKALRLVDLKSLEDFLAKNATGPAE